MPRVHTDGGRRPLLPGISRNLTPAREGARLRVRFARILAFAAALIAAAANAESVQVRTVLDGDSLRLTDGRDVRLIGINTPEFGKDGRPDQPLAAAARDRVAALVRGRTVRLVYDAERYDRYRRTLAYVVLPDGGDLQEQLLREGLAWFVAVPPNVTRLAQYRSAEAVARDERRGIWALPEYTPTPAERLTRADTGFRRIAGTVDAVRYRRDDVLLRLGAEVYLVISRTGGFPASPREMVGRRVLARGWVTEYKDGLRLRITHPAMLELPP